MSVAKLSVTLPDEFAGFVENLPKKAWSQALTSLRGGGQAAKKPDLETAYREATAEYDQDWETTVADGLPDEAW